MNKLMIFRNTLLNEEEITDYADESGIFFFTRLSTAKDKMNRQQECYFHIGKADNLKEECQRLIEFIKTKGIKLNEIRFYYKIADVKDAATNDFIRNFKREFYEFLPVKEL